MQLYQVYLEAEDGSFGSLRSVWLLDDAVAANVAQRALVVVPGVDVWRDGKRVLFATRDALMKKAG